MKKGEEKTVTTDPGDMLVRPYQLMCLICRLGQKDNKEYYFEERLNEIQAKIARNSDLPICLICNVESTFRFQNSGTEYDTPEGNLFNLRRDLTILQKLGATPGAAYPATDLIKLIIRDIASCDNICGFNETSSTEWSGCAFAHTGNYQRGLKIALKKLIRAARTEKELACSKKQSAKELYQKEALAIRPHHLLCMACFAGKRKGDEFKPIAEDHLYEAIDICRKNPEIPIKLIAGPCMICEPCFGYSPDTKMCSASFAMGLRDQKKDLDTLQLLGLKYGDILTANKLFDRIFEKIKTLTQVCGFTTAKRTGPAWSICSGEGNIEGHQYYKDVRAEGLLIPGVKHRN